MLEAQFLPLFFVTIVHGEARGRFEKELKRIVLTNLLIYGGVDCLLYPLLDGVITAFAVVIRLKLK